MKNVLAIGLWTVFAFHLSAQSGWVKQKGELYAQVSATTFASDAYYGLTGEQFSGINTFRQQSLNLYAEYGLTPRFTGILQAGLLRLHSFPTTDVVAAPGDVRLEIKYALSKKIPLSLSLAPEIPIGPADNFATAKQENDLGIREQINLATTDGEINVWTTLAASHSFLNGKGWLSAFGAFNWRTKGFSHQFREGLELGFKPVSAVYLKSGLTLLHSIGTPKQSVPFFRGEGTEMAALALGAGWQMNEHWGLSFDYWHNFDGLLAVKNAYVGPVFSVGVTYNK